MSNRENKSSGTGVKIAFAAGGIIIIALLVVIVVLLLRGQNTVQPQQVEEPKRNVVVTEKNVEQVLDSIEKMEEAEKVAPGYYTVTMNTTWHFKSGTEASYDAVVRNVETNTNDVYFDIALESDEENVIYKSPVIPRGGELKDILLDKDLEAGTYPCIVTYNLIDENQISLSTLRVTLNIIVEK